MKALQKFSSEYLEQCKHLKPEETLKFLDDFRRLHGEKSKLKSKLISMKVSEPLLEAFKKKSELPGIPYQTQIKKLMLEWLKS
ncbi:MAG: hypothetical protein AB7F59_03905 [Bdellovibrionales bacterium]